jgi:hypothetical protein
MFHSKAKSRPREALAWCSADKEINGDERVLFDGAEIAVKWRVGEAML